jgi:hypothetical protein
MTYKNTNNKSTIAQNVYLKAPDVTVNISGSKLYIFIYIYLVASPNVHYTDGSVFNIFGRTFSYYIFQLFNNCVVMEEMSKEMAVNCFPVLP